MDDLAALFLNAPGRGTLALEIGTLDSVTATGATVTVGNRMIEDIAYLDPAPAINSSVALLAVRGHGAVDYLLLGKITGG